MFGLLISIVCLLGVAFIAWWFFAEHEKVSGHARQKLGRNRIYNCSQHPDQKAV